MKWLDTYQVAQKGTKIPFKNPEHPYTDKSLFEQYGVTPISENTDRNLTIKDPRKILATSQQPIRPNSDNVSGNYNSYHLDELINEAKKSGMSQEDIWNLTAMGFQETKWGKADENIGHVNGNFGNATTPYRNFINAYKTKQKEADRLGYTSPEMRLQMYNGMGIIKPETEQDYHGFKMKKIYGVNVPSEGISMKQNPLYGKQIIDIRDNVLKKNPGFVKYMDSIQKAPIMFGSDYIEPLHPEELRQDSFEDVPKEIPKEFLKLVQKKKAQNGIVIEDNRGQWAHPGKVTKINSNQITMKGVNYPLLGISDTGDVQYMEPNQEYKFDGNNVTEFPLAQNGKTINLNEISLKTKLSQSDKVKAYRDSLQAYNNSKKEWDKIVEKEWLDDKSDLEEIIKSEHSSKKDKEEAMKRLNKGKSGYITYENFSKERMLDNEGYKTPNKKMLNPTEFGRHEVNTESYDNNYPFYLDDYTSSVILNDKKIKPILITGVNEGFGIGIYKKPTKPEIEKVNHLSQKDIEFESFVPNTELAPSPFYTDSYDVISKSKSFQDRGTDNYSNSTTKKFNNKKELEDYIKYEEGIGHKVNVKENIKRKNNNFQNGGELINFTNDNTTNWLDKYK